MDRSSFTLRVKKCIQANAAPNESAKMYSIFPYSIMNTIETIVRELEQIPEPMQLSVLEFIRSFSASAITENNQPSVLSPRILGLNRGAMKMRADFDEPLPDEFWLGEE
jgi:hypothetical protein